MYQLPFEAEVGTNPTLEELRACVSEQGMRPKLKAGWTRDPVSSFEINYKYEL